MKPPKLGRRKVREPSSAAFLDRQSAGERSRVRFGCHALPRQEWNSAVLVVCCHFETAALQTKAETLRFGRVQRLAGHFGWRKLGSGHPLLKHTYKCARQERNQIL